MNERSSSLQIEDLWVSYDTQPIIAGLSFAARFGEIVGVSGNNGSGKSTLAGALMGYLPVQTGRISLGPRDITRASVRSRWRLGIGFCPQHKRIFPDLTILENLTLGRGQVPRLWPAAFREFVDYVFPDLRERFFQRASNLSGGEQFVVALIRSIARRPIVLILDEPLAGLSGSAVPLFLRGLRTLADQGLSVILIEHNQMALTTFDRSVLLKEQHALE